MFDRGICVSGQRQTEEREGTKGEMQMGTEWKSKQVRRAGNSPLTKELQTNTGVGVFLSHINATEQLGV